MLSDHNKKQLPVLDRYCDQQVNFKKIFSFNYSLFLSQIQDKFRHYHCWDEIIPHIFLGEILTKKKARALKSAVPKLSLVISVVEPFEFNRKTVWCHKMQTPDEWVNLGVEHFLINVPDCTADLPYQDVERAIQLIDYYRSQGLDVYIHCKAGMGRSATLVAIYLLLHQLYPEVSLETVASYLKSRRKQVNLKDIHYAKIEEVCEKYRKSREIVEHSSVVSMSLETRDLRANLDAYFSSSKAKKCIAQFASIKMLMIFGSRYPNTKCDYDIKNFIETISNANNAKWYVDLLNGTSPLNQLADFQSPHSFFKKKPFKKLWPIIQQLKMELANHLKLIIESDQNPLECQSSLTDRSFHFESLFTSAPEHIYFRRCQ